MKRTIAFGIGCDEIGCEEIGSQEKGVGFGESIEGQEEISGVGEG